MKKYVRNEQINHNLIQKLIFSYMGLNEGDQNRQKVFDFVNNFLTQNSMIYTPKLNEIQDKIESLLEKLEINSQFDKARLIRDLITRLNTIFDERRINREILYNILYIILQLAQSPLQTAVDIDMLKERFEDRYMRVEANKIIKNKKFDFNDVNFQRTVQFEHVDYNEESEEFSDESELIEEDKRLTNEKISLNVCKENLNQIKENNFHSEFRRNENLLNLDVENHLMNNNKIAFYSNSKNVNLLRNISNENNKSLLEHLIKINARFDNAALESLTKVYFSLFNSEPKYNNCVSIHNLVKLSNPENNSAKFWNGSCNQTQIEKNLVTSDYLLSIILVNLTYFDFSSIEVKFHFLNKFQNHLCIDLEEELFKKILNDFNQIWNSLNFLRQFELILVRHEIKSLLVERFSHIIKEFLSAHDKILSSMNLLLNYQNGKLFTTNDKELYIASSSKLTFINELISSYNKFAEEISEKKIKFSLSKFFFFYLDNLSPNLDHFICICRNTILIKTNLKKLNKTSNSLFVKYFLDMIYHFTKSKMNLIKRNLFCVNFEVFFNMIEILLQLIYEFVINGNLIDIHNEFFVDHLITKRENTKIIYNFNEKFQNFNWIDSFKIKSFTLNKIESACVPQVFMLNNIHFKILETCKSTFLIKNLKNSEKNKSESDIELLSGLSGDNFNIWKFNQTFNDYLKEQLELFHDNTNSEHLLEDKFTAEENSKRDTINILNQNLEINKNLSERMMTEIPFKSDSENYLDNNLRLNLLDDYNSFNYIDDILNEKDEGERVITNNIAEEDINININPVEKINYKSYYTTHDGHVEEMKEIDLLQSLINSEEERIEKKTEKKKKELENSETKSAPNNYLSFDLDHIVRNLAISQLASINKVINKKLLSFLFDVEKLSDHFNLVFNIFLFKAGYSMNKFVLELNSYLNSGAHADNFFLMNLLNELGSGSDLRRYREKILNFVSINFKETKSVYFNFQKHYLLIEYLPKQPISIFFDNGIVEGYNIIFNYLFRIKRASVMIINADIDKKLKKIDLILIKNRNSSDDVYNPNQNESGNYIKNFAKKILIHFVNFRISISNFLSNLEFYIFYSIIEPKIQLFSSKIKNMDSIDALINSHVKLVREILICLGIKEELFTKILWKTLNLINSYIIILNKFELTILKHQESEEYDQTSSDGLEYIYTDLIKFIEKFKRKEAKFEFIFTQLKTKINFN